MKNRVLLLAALSALAACGAESPESTTDAPPPPAADQRIDAEEAIDRAINANPIRTPEASERDARSKPGVILGLLALEPGDTAVDLLGGGGYYTDLMAGIVGEEGQVILHNNTPYHGFAGERATERYVDNPIAGISYLKSDADDLQLAPESLDAALMVMSYHDLYVVNPERGWTETDVPLFFAQIHAALKPGGRLVIVDHAAQEGTGSEAAQELHRIDEAQAIADVEGSGLRLVATSDALRNPEDGRDKMVFDPSIRGKTDRFVLVFEKQ